MSLHYCFTCEHCVSTKEMESSHKGHRFDSNEPSAFYFVRVFVDSLLREAPESTLLAEH
jgi:hypothetical protein